MPLQSHRHSHRSWSPQKHVDAVNMLAVFHSKVLIQSFGKVHSAENLRSGASRVSFMFDRGHDSACCCRSGCESQLRTATVY